VSVLVQELTSHLRISVHKFFFVTQNCGCCFRGSDPCWGKDHRGGENAYYWRWAAALVNSCKFML